MSVADIMGEITRHLKEGGDWCKLPRAEALATLVIALRPRQIVEVGIWCGGSAIPMLIALRHLHTACDEEVGKPLLEGGRMLAIDPWAASASAEGQNEVNRKWWHVTDHEFAFRTFCERMGRHGVGAFCDVARKRSDDVDPPAVIDLLSIDGNHGEQAIRDVDRFAPRVPLGGILALDDVGWSGGDVEHARELAVRIGFVELYRVGTGAILQRRTMP